MSIALPEGATNPAKLPQYGGRPVPWATLWTGEQVTDPMGILPTEDGPMVTYPTGAVVRDDWGFLWRREGICRKGEPLYAQLSAYRQRASMAKGLCHVCGRRLPPGRVKWLVPRDGLEVAPTGQMTVISPPTCDGCVPLAQVSCPHLIGGGGVLLTVRHWSLFGAIGELFVLDGFEVVERQKDVVLQYGRTYQGAGPRNFIARQAVVALDDFDIEDLTP